MNFNLYFTDYLQQERFIPRSTELCISTAPRFSLLTLLGTYNHTETNKLKQRYPIAHHEHALFRILITLETYCSLDLGHIRQENCLEFCSENDEVVLAT
jgi:hypothetical protein